MLSGTPTTAGKYAFKVSVDGAATASLSLLVRAAPTPTPGSTPAGGGGLAMTGMPALPLLILAAALLIAGILLTTIRKRGSRR